MMVTCPPTMSGKLSCKKNSCVSSTVTVPYGSKITLNEYLGARHVAVSQFLEEYRRCLINDSLQAG